jgi:hypothetical protein
LPHAPAGSAYRQARGNATPATSEAPGARDCRQRGFDKPVLRGRKRVMIDRVVKLSEKLEGSDPNKPDAITAAWTDRIVDAATAPARAHAATRNNL